MEENNFLSEAELMATVTDLKAIKIENTSNFIAKSTLVGVTKSGSTLYNNPVVSTDNVNFTTVFENGKQVQIQNLANGAGLDVYFNNGTAWTNTLMMRPDGSIYKIGGGSFLAISDKRVKQDIKNFSSGLDKIVLIEPKQFKYKAVPGTHTENYDENVTQVQRYGVIAQDLQVVCPEMVTTDEKGFLSVDLSNLSLLLINAVKELNTKISSLEARILALETPQA
jgi:hypothetical protein